MGWEGGWVGGWAKSKLKLSLLPAGLVLGLSLTKIWSSINIFFSDVSISRGFRRVILILSPGEIRSHISCIQIYIYIKRYSVTSVSQSGVWCPLLWQHTHRLTFVSVCVSSHRLTFVCVCVVKQTNFCLCVCVVTQTNFCLCVCVSSHRLTFVCVCVCCHLC